MAEKTLPKIGIIGAGPAGLILASLLQRSPNPIDISVFDLRPCPTASDLNTPSGSLDLHPESGLSALDACGLLSKFKLLSNSECSEEMILCDRTGKVRWHDHGNGDRPEISRNALSDLLLSSVSSELIRWNTKIASVTPIPSSPKWNITYTTHGSEQATEEFDFVVGADGAWSKARSAIPSTSEPFYCGVSNILLTIPALSTAHPALSSMVGPGSWSATGEHKGVMCQRGSLGSARVYIVIANPSPTFLQESGLAGVTGSVLKTRLLESGDLYQGWGQQIKELIAAGCDAEKGEVWAKPMYQLPNDHTWTLTSGLTLIGDAAHLISPFAGEGVNSAMLDALELSKALSSPFNEWDGAVEEFEKRMWARSKEIADRTTDNLKMIFEDENAPDKFVKFFESHMGPQEA